MDLSFYFKLLLRRLHYVLFFLAIGTAVGLSLALMLPPSYSASATLLVESEQIPGELAATTVQTEAAEALEIIRQRILTRARLLELANQFEVYGPPSGEQRRSMTPDDVVSDLRDRIAIRVSGGGRIAGATIVSVGFSAPDGRMAADVANDIVRQILEENLTLRRGAASDTLAFFVDEVRRLDRELARREAELLAFREENLDALPDSLDFRRSQQASLVERVLQLQRLEAALIDRRGRLVTLFETTGILLNQQPDRPRTPNEVQLEQLRNRLAIARGVMSDSNPQMVILQSQVNALQDIVAEEQAALAGNSGSGDVQLSAFEIQLADIDAQVAASAEERARLSEELEALQASISATPANAIRLQTMQRDYDAVRTQYERAVSNRAAAETGDVIENLSKGQRISVVEQAIAPSDPTSPNRPLIAAGGVAMGGALGLGLVALLELLNTSIRRPKDLETRLGIRAFGTVPLMRTTGQVRRRRLVIAAAFLLVAIGIPSALFYVHTNVTPLDLALTRAATMAGLDNLPLPF